MLSKLINFNRLDLIVFFFFLQKKKTLNKTDQWQLYFIVHSDHRVHRIQ